MTQTSRPERRRASPARSAPSAMLGSPEVYTFKDSEALATRLGRRLGTRSRTIRLHRFPDGESIVRVPRRASSDAVLVRCLNSPNSKLFDTLLAADALRRAGARRITLVAPYLPYMRQDAIFHPGEPLSQRVLAALLGRSFDRLLTVEAHLHRISALAEVFPCRAESLTAAPAIAAWIRRFARDCIVVGPDRESRPWIEAIASAADVAAIVGEKRRLSDRSVRIKFPSLPPSRRAVIVDDIASSGSTLRTAADSLRRGGIEQVDAVIVHAIFGPGVLAQIKKSGIRRLVSCNSVPHASNCIDLAPLLAAALLA